MQENESFSQFILREVERLRSRGPLASTIKSIERGPRRYSSAGMLSKGEACHKGNDE